MTRIYYCWGCDLYYAIRWAGFCGNGHGWMKEVEVE